MMVQRSPEMVWMERAAQAEAERDRWISKYLTARMDAGRSRRAFVMVSWLAFLLALAALFGWLKLEIFAR